MQRALPLHARNSRWKAEVHTHDAGQFDLSDAVVSASTRKSLSEPAGVFTMTLKPSARPGGEGVDLLSQIRDDDWVLMGATDADGADWLSMTGLVDGVRRQRVGTAGSTTYTVRGRDLGKVMLKTDMLDMPWLGISTKNDILVIAASAVKWAVDALGKNATPGRVLDVLVRFTLGDGKYRGRSQLWAVPPSFRINPPPGKPAVDPLIRQVSDILSLQHIDLDTEGKLPSMLALPTGLTGGGSLWALLQQYGNPLINEIVVDDAAIIGAESSPTAFVIGTGADGATRSHPSIRVRQKPFPSLAYQGAAWDALPANDFPESDLEAYDVERSGAERFEWFAADSALGPELMHTAIGALMDGTVPEDRLWDAHPVLFPTSIERHGLSRFQQPTPYLDPNAEESAYLATKWAHLLRDWYAPNPVFLSGSATVAYLCPGVRVGERLRIHLRSGEVEEFYIEAVEHRFVKRPDGSAHGSTTLSVTRGWRLSDARSEYSKAVLRWLGDNLEVMV